MKQIDYKWQGFMQSGAKNSMMSLCRILDDLGHN